MAKIMCVLLLALLSLGCMSTVAQQPQAETPASMPAENLKPGCGHHQVIHLDLVPLDKTYTVTADGREVSVQLIHTVDESATLSTADIVRLMSGKGYRQATDRELAALNDALEEGMAIISLDHVSDSGRKVKCPFIRMSKGVRTSSFIDNCNELFIRGTKFFIAMIRK